MHSDSHYHHAKKTANLFNLAVPFIHSQVVKSKTKKILLKIQNNPKMICHVSIAAIIILR